MVHVKWRWLGVTFSTGILSLFLSSCLFLESTPVERELDEDFNKEPYQIGFIAYNDSMRISVLPPRRASLKYCMRSLCGRTNPLESNSVGGMFALDDTISVLWSNRSGDTLRTLVQIDRDWFTDGIVVAGDTLRIRRPQGTVISFNARLWGKNGSWLVEDTLQAGEKMLEVIAFSPGGWENLSRVYLRKLESVDSDMGIQDTVAINPVQYVNLPGYTYLDPDVLLQDGFSRDYVTIR